MLFKQTALEGIAGGQVTLAYRRWKKAAVKEGSRLHTAIGLVEIGEISIVVADEITEAEADKAGYRNREQLLKEIDAYSAAGEIYRMEVKRIGDDPRLKLRERDGMDDGEMAELRKRLDRLDRASVHGAWTKLLLQTVARQPGVRAGELADSIGWDKEQLKLNVRKLKNLGLTISLGTGYRISPRGQAFLGRREIKVDDLTDPAIAALLQEHVRDMTLHSSAESMHALDLQQLREPGITFWTVWERGELAGCGALKELEEGHGELKSMRTSAGFLRQGVARQLLEHIIAEAHNRGYRRLSLETGAPDFYAPARQLYESFGFGYCGPFADYREDPYSLFMTKVL